MTALTLAAPAAAAGHRGAGRRLLAQAQFANSVGDGAYLVASAFYFAKVVGLPPAQIGIGLTAGWAVGMVAGVPLGHLADRRGPRGVAVTLAVATAVAVASFALVRSFVPFLLVTCLYGIAQTGLSAARQALLAGLVPPAERTSARAMLQATLNGGLAAGAGLGGIALWLDTPAAYTALFALDAAGFLVAAALLLRLPALRPAGGAVPSGKLTVLRDRPYALVTLINAVLLFYMPLLSVIVPLWIAGRTSAPSWVVAALLLVNTGSVLAFQVRVARRVRTLREASASVRRAGLMMLAACAVFALSPYGWPYLLLGAALLVWGEMLLAAGAWEISFGLAPDDRQGQYQGFFGTGTAVARMLGPVALTALVLGGGTLGWLALGAMFAAAGAAMAPAVRWARRSASRSAERA
ncbi:MFS transporter [Nonomuraea wenchangensis]|uniref:Major Facilitator Superfamily protein n=1 Tax=Nonomuraea wenchangensis TaxID=568860 RepID=A0A1I0H3T8_9ACTN|nr:MFS transporter [Nonomuraea wenchangensis]SET77470.1 Major Facilitator Superfamily protein [Nonomuraea wenchangensis]